MDIETPTSKHYPKFVGVLLALVIPGIAHFLSGRHRTGLLFLLSVTVIPVIGLALALLPSLSMIYTGLVLLALITPALSLYILITSWRAIPHMPGRKWAIVTASILLLIILNGLLESILPALPYQIPPGAMQPTLMGVHTTNEAEQTTFFDHVLYGRYAATYTASSTGSLNTPRSTADGMTFNIGDTQHELPAYAFNGMERREHYTRGDTLWSGTVIMGDHVLADKLAYLFEDPKRGDIVTFRTSGLDHPSVKTNTVYVKRIVGLPGEHISIANGYVMVDGEAVTTPAIFQTLEYDNDGELSDETKTITLGADEYLMLGDNPAKNMSFDGRFYGPVRREAIIARVKTVYWPVNRIRTVE